jgi:hypothetical protein
MIKAGTSAEVWWGTFWKAMLRRQDTKLEGWVQWQTFM